MKLGIMQPYFFPYIGYWQLMHAVDSYVIYDDVNYIKGGWVNRNRILVNGEAKYFNLQLSGASPNKKINEIYVTGNISVNNKNLRILEADYKKAPHFSEIFPVLEEIIQGNGSEPVSLYLKRSFEIVNNYLEQPKKLLLSSELKKDCTLTGEEKVLAICEELNATEYYNAMGGMELYSTENFKEKGIDLRFLKSNRIEYKQFSEGFFPNLSIIDVLMFNSKSDIRDFLGEYTLINNSI